MKTNISQDLFDDSVFIVELSNNVTIVQDDYKTGEWKSWQEVKEYCRENKLNIHKMFLRFRSHIVEISPFAEGYYLGRGVGRGTTMPTSINQIITGTYHARENIIRRTWWAIPELIPLNTDTISYDECIKENLIVNEF